MINYSSLSLLFNMITFPEIHFCYVRKQKNVLSALLGLPFEQYTNTKDMGIDIVVAL